MKLLPVKRLRFLVGAGDRGRTGDINLGKVALYQLSYSRVDKNKTTKSKIARI